MGSPLRPETHVAYAAECPQVQVGFGTIGEAKAFAANPGPYWSKFPQVTWLVAGVDDEVVNRPYHGQEEYEYENRHAGDVAMCGTTRSRIAGHVGPAYDEPLQTVRTR